VRKRHFLRHLCIKTMILPRQARDKHREDSKKERFLTSVLLEPPENWSLGKEQTPDSPAEFIR
jgi:hypothetical protein